MSFETIGRAFVEHFYKTFDTNRADVAALYQDNALMTYEGSKVQGKANILNKLSSLTFKKVKRNIYTIECQPSLASGILILVTGDIKLDDEDRPFKFSQLFHLVSPSPGKYSLTNDIFSIILG